ncbi:MAG: ATP-binding cassette domain-containing protein [Halobacteriaceae archaeon]
MIEVEGLRKTYNDVVAVAGSDFSVQSGEVYGLVGPNGAGKTTTLKMITGLLEPTTGNVRVAGGDPQNPSTRKQLGWLPEESPLYEDMTPMAYLKFFADIYDVPKSTANDRISTILDRLNLPERKRRLGACSKGMKRKVAIARSLINDPSVLVFDEPASGLDPLTTHEVNQFTQELADQDKTILLSAHNLHHIQSICDRVAIMHEGTIITQGSLQEIQAEYGSTKYHIYTSIELPMSTEVNGEYRCTVESMDEVDRIRDKVLAKNGQITDIRTEESDLEDIFLSVTTGEA